MKRVQERLKEYGKQYPLMPEEIRVKEVIWRGQAAFFEETEKFPASYLDFFWQQAGYIRKRWWGLQFLALLLLWCWVCNVSGKREIQGTMGIMAAVFAILLIPELWKNRAANAMEIEGSAYYSLRQIYAARMLLFAFVDGLLLASFTGILSLTSSVDMMEIVIHFFLPMIVTCCICFRTFGSRYAASEYTACFFVMLWSAVWFFIVLNDRVYGAVSRPVWIGVLSAAVLYLTYAVRRVMRMHVEELGERGEW